MPQFKVGKIDKLVHEPIDEIEQHPKCYINSNIKGSGKGIWNPQKELIRSNILPKALLPKSIKSMMVNKILMINNDQHKYGAGGYKSSVMNTVVNCTSLEIRTVWI